MASMLISTNFTTKTWQGDDEGAAGIKEGWTVQRAWDVIFWLGNGISLANISSLEWTTKKKKKSKVPSDYQQTMAACTAESRNLDSRSHPEIAPTSSNPLIATQPATGDDAGNEAAMLIMYRASSAMKVPGESDVKAELEPLHASKSRCPAWGERSSTFCGIFGPSCGNTISDMVWGTGSCEVEEEDERSKVKDRVVVGPIRFSLS
ncbi:hypothetical protein CVT26_001503 [Gymnopilus dilepis]|uniref:Uncharacterized protein n=1 Tax=Gymnopilus dilepis TaxID=231916 RepID=A0A409YXD0_9AGAR|nr:hypothetical protein CVT26_001503 [Gymnopilus dilepis]